MVSVQKLVRLYRSAPPDLAAPSELLRRGIVALSPVARFVRIFFDPSFCSELLGRCFDDPRQTLVGAVLTVVSATNSNSNAFSVARRSLGTLRMAVKALPSVWIYKSTLAFAVGLHDFAARPVIDLLKSLNLATDFNFDDHPKFKSSTDHVRITLLGAVAYEVGLKLASGTITSEEAAESVRSILDTYLYLYRALESGLKEGLKIWEVAHRAAESVRVPDPVYEEFYEYFDLLILDAANIAVIHLGADPRVIIRNGSLKQNAV